MFQANNNNIGNWIMCALRGVFPKQPLRLPRLAQKNETMGTDGTRGTNYFSHGINELRRRVAQANCAFESGFGAFQK